jgi:hypothetical protein
VTLRLPSRPLSVLVGLALLAPAAARAADPPAPLAAPSAHAPAATPPAPVTTAPQRTSTYTPASTAPVQTPNVPTAAQRAAERRATQRARAGRLAAARRHRQQLQLLAAAQTHAEAVLRAELTAARRANAVALLAGSVADSIGAAPAARLSGASAMRPAVSSGGGSMPLPALMLGACAALLGVAAAFASRRGAGFATASLSLLVLLLAGI